MAKPQTSNYWLVKSEPDCFSIQHLAASPKQTTSWTGVRNFQARNHLRNMKLGDRVLFHHSSADPPAVAGTAVVAREAHPDPTALDKSDDHYDPKSSPANPVWVTVDIRLESVFPEPIPIGALRAVKALDGMELLRKGSRLSVQPVSQAHFDAIVAMARSKPTSAPSKTAKTKKPAAASKSGTRKVARKKR
jgi:predicted RNA-binding protein with PUA-like domain